MSTEPFLPAQRRTRGLTPKRVILVWSLLILFFVGLYQLVSKPGEHVPPPSDLIGLPAVLAWVLGGMVVWIVVLSLVQQKRVRAAIVMNGEGLQLLGRGEVAKARALFEAMGRKFRRIKVIRVLAQHNLAWTMLLEGDLERATAELVALHQSDRLRTVPSMQGRSMADLALCYTLAGNHAAAIPWLDEAEKQKAGAGEPLALEGQLALVRALIACRSDQAAQAARSLENDWHALEGLSGDIVRPLRLVRAFALAASGGPRDDGAVDRLLAPLRDSRPGSLRYLTIAWAELGVFMDAHNLS